MKSVIIHGNEYSINDDGETHINIYSNSKQWLGRALSNFTHTPLVLDGLEFESLEGYYHYLKAQRAIIDNPKVVLKEADLAIIDELRGLYGREAQVKGRAVRRLLIMAGMRINDIPNEEFINHFKTALHDKVVSNPELLQAVLDNELPYVHYYIVKGKSIVHREHFNWLPDLMAEVSYDLIKEYGNE